MQRRESRNELFEKWRIDKGRPPRSEKPWVKVRKINTDKLTDSDFHLQKSAIIDKTAKPQPPDEEKVVHTNFLKRRSGMLKWTHFGYSEDAKRRRFSPRLADKENVSLTCAASENSKRKNEYGKEVQLNETPSVPSKEASVENELVKKSRRELLIEWKNAKKAFEDSKSNEIRRQTISVISVKHRTIPESLRRQTMIISKKSKIQIPPTKIPAKAPSEFKNLLPADKKIQTIPVNPRRQTLVIQSKSTACLPKKVASSSDGPAKSGRVTRCVSQLVLNRQKAKDVQPSQKVHSSPVKTDGIKREVQKPTVNNDINVLTNKVRASLHRFHLKTAGGSQTSQIQTANKRVVQNAKNVQPVLRNRTFSTVFSLPKTTAPQSGPAKKSATLQAKRPSSSFVIQGKPSNATGTSNIAKKQESRISTLQNVESRPAVRSRSETRPVPVLSCASKVNGKRESANVPQFPLPLVTEQPDAKTSKKSNLVSKSASKMQSKRKSVAFEIPIRDGNSCKSPSLRRRLSSWLESHNHTPTAFRHLHCFGVELSELKRKGQLRSRSLGATPSLSSLESPADDAYGDQSTPHNTRFAGRTPLRVINKDESTLNTMHPVVSLSEAGSETESEDEMKEFDEALANLSILLDSCYSLQEATEWLDAMFEKTQNVCKLAAYWECRAKISDLGNNTAEALALLAAGANCCAQPLDKLLDMRTRLIDENHKTSFVRIDTPRPQRHRDYALNAENVFSSTLINYIVKDETPISKRFWPHLRGETAESLVTVTPVRRSHRRSSCSLAFTPSSTSKRSTVQFVPSLDDIPDDLKSRMVIVPNPPLKMLLDSPRHAGGNLML